METPALPVLCLLCLINVSALVVVTPADVPWRHRFDFLLLFSIKIDFLLSFASQEVVIRHYRISLGLSLALLVLLVLESGVLVPLQDLLFLAHFVVLL